MKHNFRLLNASLLVTALGFGLAFVQPTSVVPKLPNILLILTDDQGYHDVSYYGTNDLRTPYIDSLARSGMRFDNFYANCPVCSPTRAALLSGRYPDRVGVPGVIRTDARNSWGYLSPDAVLLPVHLKKRGYHTALIGKWHLGLETPNLPNDRGFDLFKGWTGDMMDDYLTHRRHGNNYMRENRQTIDPPGHATDLFSNWAVDYVRQQATRNGPFFLYLAYNAPHDPIQPPAEWLARVTARKPGIDPKRAALVALIEHMDDGIGRVIRALRESGQYDNTLIVFSSDNGGHLPLRANNGPFRAGKESMYEGGLRVPTCIAWPGRVMPGSVSEQVNLSMDLYPTLLAVADVQPQNPIDGRGFLNTLLGQSPTPNDARPLYFTRREGGDRYAGQCSYALREGNWKLVQNGPFEPMTLYDLSRDPKEEHNLASEQVETRRRLQSLLMQHIQQGGRVPWQRP
ncbi:MAG: N-acetylgalactosamine 6-sulfate sulfatase [Cytophagales bacterium]|nr:MAG: N-acetylgalactosamine 6-sulfate sulfatase [Cytophagales bacterium]